jgi:hypothetical protein
VKDKYSEYRIEPKVKMLNPMSAGETNSQPVQARAVSG